jgi:hypothetical protein
MTAFTIEFTVEQGINIQRAHLNEWKTVLTPDAYAALEEYATRDNDKALNGQDICRGTSLSSFVQQYAINVTYNYKTSSTK